MHRNRIVLGVVVGAMVVSLGVLVSGCVATVGNIVVHAAAAQKTTLAGRGKPHVGECWQASYKDVDGFANWGDRPAVPCADEHQLYTFAVTKLEAKHKGTLFDSRGYAYSPIEDDAFNTCYDFENTALTGVDETVARVYTLQILPDEQQWNAGARWVRCDVGVLAVGSSVAHPSFERLPASEAFYKELRDDASQFDFCVDDPGGVRAGGPKGSDAVYADCRYNPQWVLRDYKSLVPGDSNSYPSASAMQAQYQVGCEQRYADATHVTYAYYPSKSDWASDDETYECWVGIKQ